MPDSSYKLRKKEAIVKMLGIRRNSEILLCRNTMIGILSRQAQSYKKNPFLSVINAEGRIIT